MIAKKTLLMTISVALLIQFGVQANDTPPELEFQDVVPEVKGDPSSDGESDGEQEEAGGDAEIGPGPPCPGNEPAATAGDAPSTGDLVHVGTIATFSPVAGRDDHHHRHRVGWVHPCPR